MRVRSVSIADLKNNLSAYLGRVRHGDEILVRDRNVPIAKIVPLTGAADFDAEEEALAAAGKLRLPDGPLPASFWKRRAPHVSPDDVLRAVRADRDDECSATGGRAAGGSCASIGGSSRRRTGQGSP